MLSEWRSLPPSRSLSLAPWIFPSAPLFLPSAHETLDALVIRRCHLDREKDRGRESGGGAREVDKAAYLNHKKRIYFLQIKQTEICFLSDLSPKLQEQKKKEKASDMEAFLPVNSADFFRPQRIMFNRQKRKLKSEPLCVKPR